MARILIITPWYPNAIHQQDGNFVRAQAVALAAFHSVEVLCVAEGAGPQVRCTVEEQGVRVVQAHYRGDGPRLQRLFRRRAAWRAALCARQLQPDLIHAHVLIDGGIVAARLARRLGVPYLVTEHSSRWLRPWPFVRRPERWLARRAAAGAEAVIAVSPTLAAGMKQMGIDRAITVLPNYVATDRFSPAAPVAGRPFTFVHVSDFSEPKRVPELLRAFAEVYHAQPDVHLHLAGNGDPAPLVALIQELFPAPVPGSPPVTITGPHAPAGVAEVLRRADAFVLPSAYETQSIVVIEALLSGLPVIATRCGGPENSVHSPQRGWLIPVNDHASLVAALRAAVAAGPRSGADRQALAEEVSAEYSSTIDQLNALYQKSLSKITSL